MATVQTVAQEPEYISIGSGKLEVQAYGDNPDSDDWVNLGLADDIEAELERTFADAEPGNGVNPLPLVVNEQVTLNFALWEDYFENLSLLDGGMSKTDATNTKRTIGGGAEVGRVRMRITQKIPRPAGTVDERVYTFYYGRLNGNENFQFKNRTETDPYNRKNIEMLFELDPDRVEDDRDQLMSIEFTEGT